MKQLQKLWFDADPVKDRMDAKRQELAFQWRGYAIKLARQWHNVYGGDIDEWESEALEALVVAAAKFDETRPSVVSGFGNFVSTLWHRIRSQLNTYRRKRGLCGQKYVPRTGEMQRRDLPENIYRQTQPCEPTEEISRAMKVLNESEREVIVGRYWRGEKLSAVGRQRGLSRERIRQIEMAALGKMRTALTTGSVEYAGSH